MLISRKLASIGYFINFYCCGCKVESFKKKQKHSGLVEIERMRRFGTRKKKQKKKKEKKDEKDEERF